MKSKQIINQIVLILRRVRCYSKFCRLFQRSNTIFNATNVERLRRLKFPPLSNLLHFDQIKARSPIFLKFNFQIFLNKNLKNKISSIFSTFFQTMLIGTYPYKNIFFSAPFNVLMPEFYCIKKHVI